MNKEAVRELKKLLGPDDFQDAIEDRLTYAFDAAGENSLPQAVIFPRNVEQISAVLRIADQYRIPVVPRGAGSGLTGGAVPVSGGLVMAMEHMNRIIEIDADNRLAIVEPNVITAELHQAVEKIGLFYPPDPASMTFSTIGGNIAENAGGMRAVKYGVTKDYVMGLEVVLPGGRIIHTGSKCIKDVVGYDLTRLFVGSEGTLGVITKAILKLLPRPESKQTLTATFTSLALAGRTIIDVFKQGVIPATLEFLDQTCLEAVEKNLRLGLPPEAKVMLLIEVDGRPDEINRGARQITNLCRANQALAVNIAENEQEQTELWRARRAVHASLQTVRTHWVEEDISVPMARLVEMLEKLERIGREHNLLIACFGHAGDGNLHLSLAGAEKYSDLGPIDKTRNLILKEVVALEGRIAAEHGIGSVKREKIGWNLDSPTLELMQEIKGLLDPNGILNPDKIFPSSRSNREKPGA